MSTGGEIPKMDTGALSEGSSERRLQTSLAVRVHSEINCSWTRNIKVKLFQDAVKFLSNLILDAMRFL